MEWKGERGRERKGCSGSRIGESGWRGMACKITERTEGDGFIV